jgi:pilus assembly protein Flp/PilA
MLKSYVYLRTHAFRVQDNLRQRRDEGATAVEYSLLVAFIAFIIIVGVTFFGQNLRNWFIGLGTTVGNWDNG